MIISSNVIDRADTCSHKIDDVKKLHALIFISAIIN